MSKPILELKEVSKIFGRGTMHEVPAVRQVSLQVFPGESVGIVGESGCGKSTIARMVTRLTDVSEGEIIFDGENITDLSGGSARNIYRKIQMVFQDPYSVFSPRMDVGTFLTEGLVYFGLMGREEAFAEAKRLMKLVELPEELMGRLPHQLSGGQLQRIVIARAVSIGPKLIFLDEATSALDVSVQKQVLKLLVKLRKELNLTYLFIGHDLAVVRSICDRVCVMYAGRIVEELDSHCLKDDAAHPYTHKLLQSIFSIRDRAARQIELETLSMEDIGYEKNGCVYQRRCKRASEECRNSLPERRSRHEGHFLMCFHPEKTGDGSLPPC